MCAHCQTIPKVSFLLTLHTQFSSKRTFWVFSWYCACTHLQIFSRVSNLICATWVIDTCDTTRWYVWHESLMCDMTHWYVWHDSLICVTWLIHMCDTSHPIVSQVSSQETEWWSKEPNKKRPYSAKETYSLKAPTTRSHPIVSQVSFRETKWWRCIGCLKSWVSFHKRTTNYRYKVVKMHRMP